MYARKSSTPQGLEENQRHELSKTDRSTRAGTVRAVPPRGAHVTRCMSNIARWQFIVFIITISFIIIIISSSNIIIIIVIIIISSSSSSSSVMMIIIIISSSLILDS